MQPAPNMLSTYSCSGAARPSTSQAIAISVLLEDSTDTSLRRQPNSCATMTDGLRKTSASSSVGCSTCGTQGASTSCAHATARGKTPASGGRHQVTIGQTGDSATLWPSSASASYATMFSSTTKACRSSSMTNAAHSPTHAPLCPSSTMV